MKFSKTPFVTVMIRYGSICGFLSALLVVAIYYMGQHPMLIQPYFDYRILLFSLFIFFGLKEFREYHQGGVLYFWQGMIGSYLIIFIASLVGSLGMFLFAVLEPRFVGDYIEVMMQSLKSFTPEQIKQVGKDVYDSNLQSIPSTNGWILAVTYFTHGIIYGLFISIILSVILRKQPKTTL